MPWFAYNSLLSWYTHGMLATVLTSTMPFMAILSTGKATFVGPIAGHQLPQVATVATYGLTQHGFLGVKVSLVIQEKMLVKFYLNVPIIRNITTCSTACSHCYEHYTTWENYHNVHGHCFKTLLHWMINLDNTLWLH